MSCFIRHMAGVGLAAALLALSLAQPARAEFFGCNDGSSHVVSSSAGIRSWRAHYRYSHHFTVQSRQLGRSRVIYADGRHREPHRTNWQ